MIKVVIAVLFMCYTLVSIAQQNITIKDENADCKNAITIDISKSVHANAPKSAGRINEITSKKGSLYYFEKEHFVVWYKFSPVSDGKLSFIITPEIYSDDYDFVLFECNGDNCCDSIRKKKIIPIRTNISRVKYELNGKTGLDIRGKEKYVHEGKGSAFSLPLTIYKGKTYYLVLDNVYGGNGGHEISFDFKPKKNKDKLLNNQKQMLSIVVVDKSTQQMINANIKLVHFNKSFEADTILRQENSSLFLAVIPDYYEVIAERPNYLSKKISFVISESDSLVSQRIELQNVKVGSSFKLEKVYFRGGSAVFVGNSQQALRKLYTILKNNPNLKIEIQGHVNLPIYSIHKYSESYYNKLSIDRAKAVYDYLVKRGIDKTRLDYKGYGYSQMIYPNAKTSKEMQMNRRVEIKIIGN